MKNNEIIEFSYYELSLLSFLQNSHPDKATDISFIKSRAKLASEAYSEAILNGYSHDGATELANEVLYQDLYFSLHDTIVNILWNEFADKIQQSRASELAIKLLPTLNSICQKYPVSNDFAYSAEYQNLCKELTEEITIYLHKYGF